MIVSAQINQTLIICIVHNDVSKTHGITCEILISIHIYINDLDNNENDNEYADHVARQTGLETVVYVSQYLLYKVNFKWC